MMNTTRTRMLCLAVLALFLLFSGQMVVHSQDKKDEELEKKYAAILGDYEFDLTELGGGTDIINFYIDGGQLWADSSDGRPGVMEPVEDEKFKFTVDDSESGLFDIEFLMDDEGKYTKCRVVNEQMGIEIIGIKVGG